MLRAKKVVEGMVKVSKGVSLPDNVGNKSPFIPTATDGYKNVNHLLEQVAVGILENMPVVLMGETGTGKTSLIRDLAAKTHNGFRRVNHNGGTSVDDVVGKILVNKEGTYWGDGVLIQAMRNGDWYVADEINASSAEMLFVYYSLLDDDGYIVLVENGGEIVRPHESFRFFATLNPSADYHGVKELNKALMSRFLALKTDFASPKVEQDILIERTGIAADVAERMVNFAGEIRGTHAKDKIQYVLSTRDLIQWARLYKIYGKYVASGEPSVLNKVSPDDFGVVKDLMGLHFSALDTPKAETAKVATTPYAL